MICQSGVIPYRIRKDQVEVLLITSSKQKHWGIPKGWIEPFMSAADSAAKEAREEAGILGTVITPAIGTYANDKWGIPLRVEVFLMQVEEVLEDWAEAHRRQRAWLTPNKAMKRVKSIELKQLLQTLETSFH